MRRASRRSEASPRGRKSVRLALGGMATTLVALGSVVSVTTPAAYANVGSANYTIGIPTDDVSGVYASPDVVGQSAPADYVVRFVVTEPLSGTSGATITITSSASLSTEPQGITMLDDTETACFQAGTNGGDVSASSLSVVLLSSCQLSAGDMVEVNFSADSPGVTGSFNFAVTTSANSVPASSNPVVVSAGPPVLSVSSAALGANATYTLSNASWSPSALVGNPDAFVLTAKALSGGTVSWYPGAPGYLVTVTPPSGSPAPDNVVTAVVGTSAVAGDTVTLVLQGPVPTGDAVTIVAKGTSPSISSSDEVSLTPAQGPQTSVSSVGPPETSTNAVLLGTTVTGVTVSASPPVAGATATYTVSFQATTSLLAGSGSDICLNEPGGPTLFASAIGLLISDTSAGWHVAATGVTFPSGSPAGDPGCGATRNGVVIPVAPGFAISAGDQVTLTIAGVTNPPPGTISDFSVATSSDPVPAIAIPFTAGANGSGGVVVSVSPATTGALATYTISNLVASGAMTGGASIVTLDGPSGTVFPNSAGYYTVEDSSTPSGSGTVSAPLVGGGSNDVSFTVPEAIKAGDDLSLTIEDVINPGSASGTYSITLFGNVTAPSPVAPFPQANVSYPNGSVVAFAGTEYVFAGGRGFGVPTPAALSALAKVDDAQAQVAPTGSAVVPEAPPRPGTLVFTRPVNGSPTIYVVGADGELHGFATPAQFLADGYDPALVVTVTSLNGLTVGATAGSEGQAGNAFSTRADGAIVVSSGTYYVFAGGRAFGIPSLTSLRQIRRTDKARVLSGTVTPDQQGASIAAGVLLSASGVVYVSYRGGLWPFRAQAQLLSDGYGGTPAVPVPGPSGLGVVATYSGS